MHRQPFKKLSNISRNAEPGVSEMIAAMLLISLVVAGAAIITVMLVSTPHPEKIPKVDIQYSNTTNGANFAHMGGDILRGDQIFIREIFDNGTYANFYSPNISYANNSTLNFIPWNNQTYWSYGSFTRVPNSLSPKAYQIIYLGSRGSEFLLKEFNKSAFQGESTGEINQSSCALESDFTPTINYVNLNQSEYSTTIQFNAINQTYTSSAGYQWGWVFSSPYHTDASEATNPSYTFTIPKDGNNSYKYEITHWVANNGVYNCSNGTTKALTIYPYMTSGSTCQYSDFSSATTCPGRLVNFVGTSSYSSPVSSWNYTYTNGTLITTGQNSNYIFTSDGSFDVMANVVYADGNYCSIVHTVEVNCCQLAADFSATENPAKTGSFSFTDSSTTGLGTINGWYWDFGDGTSSSVQNPFHQYTTCGTKSVTLTVYATDGTCGSKSITKQINVSTIPISANFNYAADPSNPFNITFTNTSSSNANITSVVWEFGDGTNGNGNVVSHIYGSEGYYPVKLTVTNDCGVTGEITITVHVFRKCENVTAEFGFTTDISTLRVVFNDLSMGHGSTLTSWKWDFGDGVSSTDQNPTHIYPRLAPYTAVLTVWNDCGKWDSVHKLVFNESCQPVHADFSYEPPSGTAPLTVTFTPTEPANTTTWHWDFGDGTISEMTSPAPITHTYVKSGNYAVTLVATNECGSSDTKQGTVVVRCPDITADFTFQQFVDKQTKNLTVDFTDISYDSSNINKWRWDFGDGNSTVWNTTLWTEAGHTISHKYPELAPYTASLTVSNDCGNSNYTYRLIYNSTPCSEVQANFTPLYVEDKAPKSVSFVDATPNATKWSWNFGDGYTSEDQNPAHLFNKSGRYTVTLTAANDCGMTGIKTGVVNLSCPNITAGFGFEYLALERLTNNLTVLLTDTSNASLTNLTRWTWTFGDGTKTIWDHALWQSSGGKIAHKYPEVAPYTAILEIENECGSTDWTSRLINNGTCSNVSVNFTPVATNGTAPLTVQFTANTTNVTSWFWNFGDGASSTDQNPTHTFNQSGLFAITLTGYSDCGTTGQKTGYVNVSCPGVTADYGYEYLAADRATNNLTVRFSDISQSHGTNITKWTWDFGDGNKTVWNLTQWTSASGQIVHKFPQLSPYLVGLTIENECGSQDLIQKLIYNGTPCLNITANFTPLAANGSAPYTVAFTDLTTGGPTRWHWDFGDGYYAEIAKNASVLTGDVNHTYNLSGHYQVTLIATGEWCGNAGVKSGYVDVSCPNVSVDFGYTHIDETNNTVQFNAYANPPLADDDITDWTWFFGDGTTDKGQNVTHTYGVGTEDTTFNVLLIATSYCGSLGQNLKIIYPYCPNLTPSFTVTPVNGTAPLTVSFTENSNITDVVAWRWFFGDGNYSYTTDPLAKTPPNHTYYAWGTYYITEQLQNKCGNLFDLIRNVTVTSPANVTGHVWDDLNYNGQQDPGEWDLANWNVTLQEKVNGVWTNSTTVKTNATGWYNISMSSLSYGIFRVVEDLPPIWNVTTSYGVTRPGPDKNPTAGTMLVYTTRNYRADFGNVDWHVSSMQLPRGYIRPQGDLFDVTVSPRYWGFSTSYKAEETQIPYYQYIIYNSKRVFQVPPYGHWGNSSFSLTPTPYSAYIIYVNTQNEPTTTVTISQTQWLERWVYNGITYLGRSFSVPDNTTYTGDLLDIYMVENDSPYSVIDPPYEGQVIPYDQHFGAYKNGQYSFFCHVTGTGTNINTTLKTPVQQVLYWNTTWAYFTLDWDNRLSEGQNVMFTTESSFHAPSNQVIRAYRNVSVDFEPLTPTFINLSTDTPTAGNITVNAQVGGHNYDKANVSVVVGNSSTGITVIPMTWTNGNGAWAGAWNNSTVTFYSESMAGRVVPMVIRATPVYEGGRFRGKTIDSAVRYVAIKSKYPIQANFTADPYSGPSPLEVAFTDTSTGGPGRWAWNFGDGTANISGTTVDMKNPVHLFNQTGTFPVTLTVWNITGISSSYQRNITVVNSWHTANLFTSRTGSLASGGYAKWIVAGSGSTVTVNGVTYSLSDGDIVQLSLLSAQSSARILVSGGITAFNCSNVQLAVNGVNLQQGACTGINIPDFDNFHSTLRIVTLRDTSAWVNFLWDGSTVKVQNSRNLDIYDLMPKTRFMDVNLQTGQVYFDGNASQYQLYR